MSWRAVYHDLIAEQTNLGVALDIDGFIVAQFGFGGQTSPDNYIMRFRIFSVRFSFGLTQKLSGGGPLGYKCKLKPLPPSAEVTSLGRRCELDLFCCRFLFISDLLRQCLPQIA